MIEFTKIGMICISCNTVEYNTVSYYRGESYYVSEFYFGGCCYYQVMDMENNFLDNISKYRFDDMFYLADMDYYEIDKMFNNLIEGDVVII